MAVTGLVKTIKTDYPSITLRSAKSFLWIPQENTVEYDPSGDTAYLLHELGHALLHHDSYSHDIELLSIERAAWTYATSHLADKYNVDISSELIEESLDTYREWMHARSTCPACHLNGIQSGPRLYRCVSCSATWSVNEARGCNLRRHTQGNHK